MKLLRFAVITMLALSACKKDKKADVGPIIEPPLSVIISKDTITTGGQWGINIGQSAADVYNVIQQVKSQHGINGLNVVNNVFSNVDDVKDKLPLYTGLFLDEEKGTPTGIQLIFASEKILAIFTNSGDKLKFWPKDTDAAATIHVGDAVTDIYPKLLSIKQKSSAANKLQRLSVFYKDLNKGFDAGMSASPQWYFSSEISEKRYNQVMLNFKDGHLKSIYSIVIGTVND